MGKLKTSLNWQYLIPTKNLRYLKKVCLTVTRQESCKLRAIIQSLWDKIDIMSCRMSILHLSVLLNLLIFLKSKLAWSCCPPLESGNSINIILSPHCSCRNACKAPFLRRESTSSNRTLWDRSEERRRKMVRWSGAELYRASNADNIQYSVFNVIMH